MWCNPHAEVMLRVAPDVRLPSDLADQQPAVVGFAFTGEMGDAVLRAEYLFVGGKVRGLRSSPA